MEYTREQQKIVEKIYELPCDETLVEYIVKNKNTDHFDFIVTICCDVLLDGIQRMFLKYDKVFEHYKNNHPKETNFVKLYLRAAEYIAEDEHPYYIAVAEYFKGNKKKTLEYLKKEFDPSLDWKDSSVSVKTFVNTFIGPFKEAFEGFWEEVYRMLSLISTEKGVLELCKAMPLFYNSTDAIESCAALEEALAVEPDNAFVKEILAINYYNAKMWGNAVALFEQIENPILLFVDDKYHMMGWCYGKLKEISNEITAYEKSVEIFPEGAYTLNNLGYAYYKAKQYNKALDCFQRCIDNRWNLDTSANNYVRTLLAMKRFRDAKNFVKNPPYKINKQLLEKVKNAENTNKRISTDKPIVEEVYAEAETVGENDAGIGAKKYQFTSEKILEEELMLRIESGMEVFGKRLKIYRRKGIFGRQYILSNGRRPDLLAEDAEGNLYVIELKKDSGYDDVYEQIVDYLKWFDENWKGKVKKIYGIICLNSPTPEILQKVHQNERIRLFEYQISYAER